MNCYLESRCNYRMGLWIIEVYREIEAVRIFLLYLAKNESFYKRLADIVKYSSINPEGYLDAFPRNYDIKIHFGWICQYDT